MSLGMRLGNLPKLELLIDGSAKKSDCMSLASRSGIWLELELEEPLLEIETSEEDPK